MSPSNLHGITGRESDLGLNSLERLGAFFTSQMHDLNNQMAVLSNSELLLPNDPTSPEMSQFVGGLFAAIHRLSATCNEFNVVRKLYPVAVEALPVQKVVESIVGAVGDQQGWRAISEVQGLGQVLLNLNWVSMVVSQLIDHMQAVRGQVRISIGELPPRQYKYSLRGAYTDGPARALLVHFNGEPGAERAEQSDAAEKNFQIALELVRLQGAGISLARSDTDLDYLIAFRWQPALEP